MVGSTVPTSLGMGILGRPVIPDALGFGPFDHGG